MQLNTDVLAHFSFLYISQFHRFNLATVDQEKNGIIVVTTQLQVIAGRPLEVLVHHRVPVLVQVTTMGLYIFYSIDHSNAFGQEYRMRLYNSRKPIIICFAHPGT